MESVRSTYMDTVAQEDSGFWSSDMGFLRKWITWEGKDVVRLAHGGLHHPQKGSGTPGIQRQGNFFGNCRSDANPRNHPICLLFFQSLLQLVQKNMGTHATIVANASFCFSWCKFFFVDEPVWNTLSERACEPEGVRSESKGGHSPNRWVKRGWGVWGGSTQDETPKIRRRGLSLQPEAGRNLEEGLRYNS